MFFHIGLPFPATAPLLRSSSRPPRHLIAHPVWTRSKQTAPSSTIAPKNPAMPITYWLAREKILPALLLTIGESVKLGIHITAV